MITTEDKHTALRKNEEKFAFTLAAAVLDKPKMGVWMILIPIILVYHVFRHQRYVAGRRAFADNYMITRNRAIEEARSMVEEGRDKDIEALVAQASLPEEALDPYRRLLRVLVEHYLDVLKADGDDFDSLIQSAYGTRTGYLLFLNSLNQAEKRLNNTLMPHLKTQHSDIDEVISRIELSTERIRRQDAERIFP